MDNTKYLSLFKTVNDFFAVQSYTHIGDESVNQILKEVMQNEGKRVRSVLCCMAHDCFAPLSQDGLYMAWAIEVFHNFTLVHDDIMDEAPLRRSQVTVYKAYGSNTAILVGDIMLIEVYDIINKLTTVHKTHILTKFNKMAKEICLGQLYDLRQDATSDEVTLEDYMKMIKLKTAVLLGNSLYLGALIGGATKEIATLFYEVGIKMGLIFQIQDDYLDLYGQTFNVGKQKGGDIIQGKKNILYFKAKEMLNEEDRITLDELMSNCKETDKVDKVYKLYAKVSLEEKIVDIKNFYLQEVKEAVGQLPIDIHHKSDLINFANCLLERMK